MTLQAWVLKAYAMGASDLHFEAGTAIVARVREELLTIGDGITESQLAGMAKELFGEAARTQISLQGSADHSTTVAGTRCRINVYRTTASSKSPSTMQWTSTRSPSGSESRATGDKRRTPAFEPLAAERAEPATKLLCSIYSERS